MNPMVRINSAPVQRPLARGSAAGPLRRVTVVKVMVWLSFAFGALTALSGLLTAALLACVSGATLLIVDGIAARDRASHERLELISKELIGLRQIMAQLALSSHPPSSGSALPITEMPIVERGADATTSLLGTEVGARAQPQPAGD